MNSKAEIQLKIAKQWNAVVHRDARTLIYLRGAVKVGRDAGDTMGSLSAISRVSLV